MIAAFKAVDFWGRRIVAYPLFVLALALIGVGVLVIYGAAWMADVEVVEVSDDGEEA